MEFRPCIDIHNGKVKQIVGSSLSDENNHAVENFVSDREAKDFANLYKENQLTGGHIILLNPSTSEYYEATKNQAILALKEFPNGLQIGGGIHNQNAKGYIDAGASHVIVTSYVFQNGVINYDHLEQLKVAIGKKHIVLDLSCKKIGEEYVVMTDRWQKRTAEVLCQEVFDQLSDYCDEFLIHAVDVEGKAAGIDDDLVRLLGEVQSLPITYAGGVRNISDLEKIYELGKGRIHVTIGSALDLFGGELSFEQVITYCKKKNRSI